jgi:hypothetical protein
MMSASTINGEPVMAIILRMAILIILLGVGAMGAAQARGAHYATHFGHMGPMFGYEPQQPVTPQFDNPGSQISVPQTGNAVDQLSPLNGAGQPDALGIK